jgi:hypothetical protein
VNPKQIGSYFLKKKFVPAFAASNLGSYYNVQAFKDEKNI